MTDREKVIKGLEQFRSDIKPFCGGKAEWVRFDAGLTLLIEHDSGWISINDRLPELNQDVLVYAVGKIDGFIGDHVVEKCKRFIQRILPSSPGEEIWSSPYQYFHTDYEITHWMPLPEPPEEGR